MKSCIKCGSDKIIEDVRISDMGMNSSDYKMHISIELSPNSIFFK